MEQLQDIRNFSEEALIEAFASIGEPKYRAKQVHEWLWSKSATSFEEMTNLSKKTRAWLEENFVINHAWEDVVQQSNDGTIKVGFRLHDERLVEGVMIPANERMTACVSSQVGCTLQCAFCATGMLKRERNLEAGEIYDQVVMLNKKAQESFGRPLSNIVYMGMGEPLLNYDNVLKSIRRITSPDGLGMSPRRITLSTVGVARGIRRLAEEGERFNLALSLHAPTDEQRIRIMPINKSNPIEELIDALNYFYSKTKNKVTFEYILFDRFNDSIKDADNLAKIAKRVPSFINVIEYNHVDGVSLQRAQEDRMDAFLNRLESHGITAKVRRSRGKDIDAACGQLANKES